MTDRCRHSTAHRGKDRLVDSAPHLPSRQAGGARGRLPARRDQRRYRGHDDTSADRRPRQPSRGLEIDMSKVKLLTSDGAMTFLAAARIAHAQGTDVTVRDASPQARATLHALGLDRLQQYLDG
ncbi:STAS domain-containing protein [Streptomyces phaeochromogenes]